jgi:HlyD family secretion protein
MARTSDTGSGYGRPHTRDSVDDNAFRVWPRIFTGFLLAIILIVGCGGWAAIAGLEGAVIATGIVKVDQNLKEVQHREGGTVKSLGVRQGDLVQEGQVLITLDEVQTKAELLIVRSQLTEALGRKARLIAERDQLPEVAFPREIRMLTTSADLVILDETRLFKGNKQARDSQKEQLQFSISQSGEEIKGLEARLAAKVQEVTLVGSEREKFLALHDKGIIDYSKVFNTQRDWARLLGERGEIQSGIARTRGKISELKVQLLSIDQNASTEAQRELRTVDAKISELLERKIAVEDRLARAEIRAPASGYVNELFVFTVGGVVAPAAKLATIVPENAELRFEAKIAPVDIDQVRQGQGARIRLSAFNRNATPEMKGRVALVSPASTRDPATGQEYYTVQVQLDPEEEAGLNKLRLVPGMPVEVFIATEQRTAMSFLAKPFTDQMNRAFRER